MSTRYSERSARIFWERVFRAAVVAVQAPITLAQAPSIAASFADAALEEWRKRFDTGKPGADENDD